MGMLLALIRFLETNPVTVSKHSIRLLIHCNNCYKQLHLSTKTELFSYKGSCSIHKRMGIDSFERASLSYT